MPDYKVQLDTYSGPMDLLLYLIRREEVDIYDIPISRILDQYLSFVRLLEALDPDAVGDFLVLAATLMEIKSRMLLPTPPPEEGEEAFDPRVDLVRQLLAYKAFRDAAGQLGQRAEDYAQRFGRPSLEIPKADDQVDIEDVQVWDLLTAFNKLLASVGRAGVTHDVIYDDTPISLHAADILDRLEREGPVLAFEIIFDGRSLSELIGLFLALLELIRQDRVRVEQAELCGPILVHLIDATPITAVLESGARATFKEPQAGRAEPADYAEAYTVGSGPTDADFDEDLGADEDDEYRRRIDSVRITEVDLGRGADNADGSAFPSRRAVETQHDADPVSSPDGGLSQEREGPGGTDPGR